VKKKAKKAKAKQKAKPKALKRKTKPKTKKAKRTTSKAKTKTKAKTPNAPKPRMGVIAPANSTLLGRVDDYYAHIGVITLTLKSAVRLGDHIHVLGHTTNLEQTLDSMQIDHQSVTEARADDGVGIKLTSRARHGDYVFRING
jgi:putative protease